MLVAFRFDHVPVRAAEPVTHDAKSTIVYQRIKTALDAVPAIDTHEHLRAFKEIPNRVNTMHGEGMTLYSIWRNRYITRTTRITPWPADGSFDSWWSRARNDFDNARATSVYRYLLPAFRDLYGVDFDTVTSDQAAPLNSEIFEHYKTDQWLQDVITKRANIELMLIDPYWNRLQFAREYRFSVPVLNVTTIIGAVHPDRFSSDFDSPFAYSRSRGRATDTFDEFLAAIDALFADAVAADAVCLKSTQAYQRSLDYAPVTKERAADVYGKPKDETSDEEQRSFEDYMFWYLCRLSANMNCRFKSTPATHASRDPIPCCWSI